MAHPCRNTTERPRFSGDLPSPDSEVRLQGRRLDIRHASGPGGSATPTDRQYADQPEPPDLAGRAAAGRAASTTSRAASSSSVGAPLTTLNSGSPPTSV